MHSSSSLPETLPETPRTRLFCAFLTAFLWWVSTLQSGLFALGWIAPLPLLWSLHGLIARARFFAGWRCGFFSFSLLNWWIAVAIVRGAPMIGVPTFIGVFLGIVGVFLIGAVHGFMLAIIAWMWNPLGESSTRLPLRRLPLRRLPLRRSPLWLCPLGLAALWTILDIARCSGALAHSWGALAYTQWRDTALLQTASVVGQHGLTFVCVWFAASAALWLRAASRRSTAVLWRAPLLAMLVLHVWGAARIGRGETPKNRSLRVLLVQTTASPFNGTNAFAQAFDLTTKRAKTERFDLIVWPETTFFARRRFDSDNPPTNAFSANAFSANDGAIEYSIGRDLDGLEVRQINELSRALQTPILSGVSLPTQNGARINATLLFDGSARVQSRAKTHLVPFGERAPWSEHLPFLRALSPSPQVEAGTGNFPLKLPIERLPLENLPGAQSSGAQSSTRLAREPISLGTLICFESCFIEPSRSLVRQGAPILVVATNDDWCGGTEAPWSHAAMSAIRAVENGVPVAQSANGGLCFAVDRWGRFVVKSRFNIPQTVAATLILN